LSMRAAAAVSFTVAALLLKTDKADEADDQLVHATADMEAMKGKKSSVSSMLTGSTTSGPIRNVVFACDAGMGSSAMGASVLRKKIQSAGYDDVKVTNQSIANLTDNYDVVVTHQDLTDRARQRTGSAVHVSVDNFMNSPRYDEIVELVRASNGEGTGAGTAEVAEEGLDSDVLRDDAIVLNGTASSRDAAITEAGQLLVDSGAVEPSYVDAMHEREQSVSTHMGNLLAIPHGTNEAKSSIRRTAISFVRYPDGIDWNGKPAEFVVGIAGAGNDHLALLSKLAGVFVDAEQVERLRRATSAADVRAVLSGVKV
jgi:PTS system mannitol-specific IIC component